MCMIKNEMSMEFDGISINESLARMVVASFMMPLNPTLEELSDVKTAVSEAVTNAIIHGYGNLSGYGKHGMMPRRNGGESPGKVLLRCKIEGDVLHIEVEDRGMGIEDVEKAMEPLFTTKPEYNRSGMGFAFMEAFMDDLWVESNPGKGTLVKMSKKICAGPWIDAKNED